MTRGLRMASERELLGFAGDDQAPAEGAPRLLGRTASSAAM
jgi:hypothetical protein